MNGARERVPFYIAVRALEDADRSATMVGARFGTGRSGRAGRDAATVTLDSDDQGEDGKGKGEKLEHRRWRWLGDRERVELECLGEGLPRGKGDEKSETNGIYRCASDETASNEIPFGFSQDT